MTDQLYTVYIAVLYFSIAVSIALIGYLWSRRSTKAILPIIGILISILFWSVGYILEYASTDLSAKLFTYNIQYLGVAAMPVMFLMFTLKYTRRDNWMKTRRLILLSIIPIITILMVWTKDFHSMMYSNMGLANYNTFSYVKVDFGPWFWIFFTYAYLIIMTSVVLLIVKLFSYPRLYLHQVISIIIIIGAPITANLLYIFRAVPALPYVDWTTPAFAISAIGMTYAVFRQRLLDILPIARDSAIEMLNDGFVVLDEQDFILDLNRAMQTIIGLPAADLTGKPLPDIIMKQLDRQNLQTAKNEISLVVKGELKFYRAHVSPLIKTAEKKEGYILLFYDITESKQFEQKLKAMATHDYLTGLPNRVLLEDRFEVALARSKRNDKKFAVMVCDIDAFKNVNDTMGHITGDKVLKSISGRLNKMMRGGDTLARTGGDEFVILLSEISTEEEAETVASRIVKAFSRPFTLDSNEINVSFSIGIAIYPDNGKKIWALLNKADSAMYQVKKEGGKGYRIFREN